MNQLLAALTLTAFALLHAQPTSPDTSAKAIVAKASAYVDDYSTKMQSVLADELATQRVTSPPPTGEWTRTTKADLFITFLQAESIWIAVRDVREVDGAAVDDPENIRVLMARAPLGRLGAVIAKKNSQFNIGNITRTFNEPTLALLVLSSKHKDRFKFDVSTDASPKVTISFKERDQPTLIYGHNGAPVYTSGTMLIDAASGRVEFTRLALTDRTVTAQIDTTYTENVKLKLWVPAVMRETYTQKAKGAEESISCESTYTNYRKFETSAIIK